MDTVSLLKFHFYRYFPAIFNMSGNQEQVEKHGNWFTHDKCPRALIFKRDQHKVDSMETLMKLMRYILVIDYRR